MLASPYFRNKSDVMESQSDFSAPILCFPDILEKKPINIVYCVIYLLACSLIAAAGLFFYFKRRFNGHTEGKQTALGELHNNKILHGIEP